MEIYLTHCSSSKDDSLKKTNTAVTPDRLYTSLVIQRFIQQCKKQKVSWAIFSDLYGVWFPPERHAWYDKSPGSVSQKDFKLLLSDFDSKLKPYNAIYFYHNPGRFHPLYKRLIRESQLKNRITLISHLTDIGKVHV